MPLWLFVVVWLAAWAVGWFGLARVWTVRARTEMLPAPPGYGWHLGRIVISRGARPWAAFLATAVAFAVEAAWLVLS